MEYVSEIELEKLGLEVEDDGIYVVKAEHVDDLDVSTLEQKLLQLGFFEAPYSKSLQKKP